MVYRNNNLNDIYKQYDTELNAMYNIDLIRPPVPLTSPPQNIGVNSHLKTSKEELENGLLLVCTFYYSC